MLDQRQPLFSLLLLPTIIYHVAWNSLTSMLRAVVGAEACRLALLSPDVADKSMDVILGTYLY